MGLGIWSMHYIGMLAFHLPIPVQYDWPTVLASLFAAILASAVALFVVSRPRMGITNAAVASLFMGAGIAGMHYIGMEAMRLAGMCHYNIPIVAVSVLLAVVISFVGLWLLFHVREEPRSVAWRKMASALAMGAAIPIMHYTGMAASTFTPSTDIPDLSYAVSVSTLGVMAIAIVTLMVLGLALLGAVLDRRYSAQALELEAADRRYRLLFERSLAGVLRTTLDGRILDCNEACARIFGFASREELMATHIRERYAHPDGRKSFLAQLEAEQSVTNYENRLLRKDGSSVWLLANTALVMDKDGVPSAIEGTLIDITERKRAEEALGASEAKFRGILECAPDAIAISDMQGRIVLVNAETERLFGYNRDEMIGQSIEMLVPERFRGTHSEHREGYAENPRRQLVGAGLDLWGLRKDRTEFPIEINLATITTPGGTLMSSAIRDVTARKRAAEELKNAKEAAETASRAKSEFLANMSHEIRTPMNGIIGMTELALDTHLTDEQREYLSMVKLSANSLLTVINDILDFSKIEAGKMELDSSEFSVRDILEETIRSFSVAAGEKHVELVCDINSNVPEVVAGDPIRLRQVVVNLLGNAIKFTDRGEVVLQAEVEQIENNNLEVHFIVRDTGIGISKDKQGLIFEAFAQADGSSSRKYGGTGLGLTISSHLVGMMGGRIWLESEPGRGSTFHFTARFELPQTATEKPKLEGHSSLAGIRVLVVDDNPTNRFILEKTLLQWGMRPTVVASGWAALAELRRAQREGQATSLVLLDAQMPQLDGFATAAKIRQDPDLPTATIMMLTSGGQRGDADRCRQVGISAYLTKPVRQLELREAILRVLGLQAHGGEDQKLVTRYSLQQTSKSFRVLLAEDNAINRELVVRVLVKRGHSVTVVPNGKLALDALEAQTFDVILMDVQMPEMDGFEATAAIRRNEEVSGAHIPIIAMTAHALKGDRERCLAAGMDEYISKPIRAEELLNLIESVTAGSGSTHNAVEATHPIIDWNLALERVDGDEVLLGDLAKLFCQEYPGMLAAVQEAVLVKDAERLERAAHTLKGSVGALGAQDACDAALTLERLARAGDLDDADEAYAVLVQKIDRLRLALETPVVERQRVPAVDSL
jgi:PAS domain S-box-containing protein